MADSIKTITLNLAQAQAHINFTRDDGTRASAVVNLAGPELTALVAVAVAQLAVLPPPPTAAEQAAARAAAEARRAAAFASREARLNNP